jgi:hypothetical protein
MNDTDTDVSVGLVNVSSGFSTGALFKVDYDNCVPLAQNVCNRSQNVYGCCNNPSDPTQFQVPPGSEICAKKGCATFKPTCTTDADCGNIVGDCSGTCTTFVPVCTTDAQCGGVAGDCQGIPCASAPEVCNGAGTDASPEFGVCVFKCPANPPVCTPGHFPASTAGTCDGTGSGPNGGCPSNNACVSQTSVMGCAVSNPSDTNGQPVSGVTCSVVVTEGP